MRIISNFKDYYDIGMTYGQDPTLVYLRKTEEIPEGNKLCKILAKAPYSISYPGRPYGVGLDIHLIGFCGRLYPLIGYKNTTHVKGDLVDFIISQNDYLKRPLIEASLNKPLSRWGFCSEFTLKNYEEWVKNVTDLDATDCCIKIQAPIFRISRYSGERMHFEKNPMLKEMGFQSVKPPVEAFQELSMFIGSALVSEKEVPVKVSDTVLRDKHGFDEWSFRRKK